MNIQDKIEHKIWNHIENIVSESNDNYFPHIIDDKTGEIGWKIRDKIYIDIKNINKLKLGIK